MSLLLLLKLLLVPALIAAVTLAGRRWGAAVAGWLSAFPVVSAPVLGFIAIERGAAFAAEAATATLSAVLAILVFGVGYCRAALRHGWPRSLAQGLAGYALAVLALDAAALPLAVSALLVPAVLWLAPRAYPEPPPMHASGAAPHGEIALRMVAGALLVLLVTGFAEPLGARMSGLLAMFPVMATVLAVFSQRQHGAGYAVRLLRGMVYGYYAFAGFCLALALALPRLPLAGAFGLALGVALALQALTRIWLQRPAKLTRGSATAS